MNNNFIKIKDKWIFISYTTLREKRNNLLFIHGLGDCGLAFQEAFSARQLFEYNIIVPDLAGYGHCSADINQEYSIDTQISCLWTLINKFKLENLYLVGHSMGGDIATIMATADSKKRIKGLVNIEGNLTPNDLFICNQATKADIKGNFNIWFEKNFKEKIVLKKWGRKWASCRRYYASLQFTQPEIFLANAKEMYENNRKLPGTLSSGIGLSYCRLKIPKVFCWGNLSLAKATRKYIRAESIENREFRQAFHWLMVDRPREFYTFLAEFIKKNKDK